MITDARESFTLGKGKKEKQKKKRHNKHTVASYLYINLQFLKYILNHIAESTRQGE